MSDDGWDEVTHCERFGRCQDELAHLHRINAGLVEALSCLFDVNTFDERPQDYMPVWHKARAALRSATETKGEPISTQTKEPT